MRRSRVRRWCGMAVVYLLVAAAAALGWLWHSLPSEVCLEPGQALTLPRLPGWSHSTPAGHATLPAPGPRAATGRHCRWAGGCRSNDPRTGDRPAHCDRLRNALWRQNVLRRGACGGLFGHRNRRRHREPGQAGWPAAGRPGDPAGGGGNRNERCRPRSAGSGRRPAAGAGLCPGQRTAADRSHPCVG